MLFRTISTNQQSTKCFDIERKEGQNYAILKLNKPPVNSFNLETFVELNEQLNKFELDKTLNGVILTSSVPNLFSAGIDINEMYKCDQNRLKTLWTECQNFWIKLYGSRKVYVAAINGHALAFGSVIVMSCDYRIMADSDRFKVGLPSVLLGIDAPFWFKTLMINTIGQRECEKALGNAKVYTPKQALNIKLIDQLVNEDDLIEQAEVEMKKWLKVPNLAREKTKIALRQQTLNELLYQRDNDSKAFIESTMSPLLQNSLGNYLKSLKNKK